MVRVTAGFIESVAALGSGDVLTLEEIAAILQGLIPCERALFTVVDFQQSKAILTDSLYRQPLSLPDDIILGALALHPTIFSYILTGDDLTPRRVTDVTTYSDWTRSDSYQMLFRSYGERFQLSLVTKFVSPYFGRGWALTRSDHDFSENCVEQAAVVLPLVTIATERSVRATRNKSKENEFSASFATLDGQGIEKFGLTIRELETLQLLATGVTASHIADLQQISTGTVNKHLEHIYAKLGVHDRVQAASLAIRLHVV